VHLGVFGLVCGRRGRLQTACQPGAAASRARRAPPGPSLVTPHLCLPSLRRYGPGSGPDFLRGEGPTSILKFTDVIWRPPVCMPALKSVGAAPSSTTGAGPPVDGGNSTLSPLSTLAAAAAAGSVGAAAHDGSEGAVHQERVCIPAVPGYDDSHADSIQLVNAPNVSGGVLECYPRALHIMEAIVQVQPRPQDIGVPAIGAEGISYS
jgi:hypothetical protein